MNCRKSILLLITLSMFGALMACGGGSSNNIVKTPTIAITASTGTGYTTPAAVGTAFGTFSATVTSNGSPAAGVSVTFTAPTAGAGIATGTFGTSATATDTETTNASGVATSATFTAGTVAGTYNVTASTSGATPSATFSVTNNAGAPSTISISGSSTESASVNTAFAPLAVKVVDGDGNPVNNATVTFTVVPGATGASAAFATSGTTDPETTGVNGVYTTSQALTANANLGNFTVTADFSGDSNPVTFTLTNTAGASLLLNPGNYVFSVGGTDSGAAGNNSTSPYFVAGVFTVNGTGDTISGGELTFSDYNYITTTPDAITGGTVAITGISGDSNLIVTINTGDTNIGPGATTAGSGSGTLVFDVAMTPGGSGTRGLISEYDSWASSSGELNLQTSTAALCPNAATTACGYAFSVGGVNGGEAPLSVGGIVVIDGASGAISGSGSIFDMNDAEVSLNPGQTVSGGTVNLLDSSGYVSIALNSSNSLFTGSAPVGMLLYGYIIDANHIRVVENWLGDNVTGTTGGTLVAQSSTGGYTNSSIAGSSYVLRAFGGTTTASGTLQIAGVLNFVADGSVTGTLSFSDLGNISAPGGVALAAETTPCSSGTATTPCYTVDASGDGDVTITNVTVGAFTFNLQLYLTGDGHAQVISMDATDVLNGNSTAQSVTLTFGGDYALGVGGLNNAAEVNGDGEIGVGTTIGGYLDTNSSLAGGGLNTNSLGASYTAPTNGIVTVTGTGNNTDLFTVYLIDATQGVIIENDNTQLNLGYFTDK